MGVKINKDNIKKADAHGLKSKGTIHVANIIKNLIDKGPYDINEVSELSNISVITLRRYMKTGMLSLYDAFAIAHIYNIPPYILCANDLRTYNYPIGDRLRELRDDRKLNGQDVADFFNIDKSIISRIENNARDITVAELHMFANFYGVSPSYLTGEINYENLNTYIAKKNKIIFKANNIKNKIKSSDSKNIYRLYDPEDEIFKPQSNTERLCDITCDQICSLVRAIYSDLNIAKPKIAPIDLKYHLQDLVNEIAEQYERDICLNPAMNYNAFSDTHNSLDSEASENYIREVTKMYYEDSDFADQINESIEEYEKEQEDHIKQMRQFDKDLKMGYIEVE